MNANEELYKTAVDYWGVPAQVDMCIEEMSELTKAICKWKRTLDMTKEPDAVRHIAEEVADVEIMLEQMKMIFSIDEQVNIEKDFKLIRLKERLEGN